MIVYFSSTGNCKYLAKKLATEFNDKCASIEEAKSIKLTAGEKLGFIFPTYFWRLPSIVTEYMNNVKISAVDTEPYIYFIASYGSTCGQTAGFMQKHLKAKGFKLSFCCSIKTVDDWSVWFDVCNQAEISSTLKAEESQINEIINWLKCNTVGKKMKDSLPMIAVVGSNVFYEKARRTKHLHVEDTCIGCGLCEKECPTKSIKLQNSKPVWINKKCTMCLHCLHNCPKFSIQYDDKTQAHGQYMHP